MVLIFKKLIRCLLLVGVAYFGPIFGIACMICYKNPFNPSTLTKLCKLNRTKEQGYM